MFPGYRSRPSRGRVASRSVQPARDGPRHEVGALNYSRKLAREGSTSLVSIIDEQAGAGRPSPLCACIERHPRGARWSLEEQPLAAARSTYAYLPSFSSRHITVMRRGFVSYVQMIRARFLLQ